MAMSSLCDSIWATVKAGQFSGARCLEHWRRRQLHHCPWCPLSTGSASGPLCRRYKSLQRSVTCGFLILFKNEKIDLYLQKPLVPFECSRDSWRTPSSKSRFVWKATLPSNWDPMATVHPGRRVRVGHCVWGVWLNQRKIVKMYLPCNLLLDMCIRLAKQINNDFHEVPRVNVWIAQLIGNCIQKLVTSFTVESHCKCLMMILVFKYWLKFVSKNCKKVKFELILLTSDKPGICP